MKHLLYVALALLFLGNAPSLVAGETKVLKELPKNYSLSLGKVVFVENDGRCGDGEVIKVTGGKKDQEIPRKYECVKRPE